MARSGSKEDKITSATKGSQGNQAFQGGQAAIKNYQAGETAIENGGSVGANPFKSADYLGNENKLQAESLDTANDSAKAQLNRYNLSTGGLNSSITPLAIRDASLQKGRLADQLSAERAASDYRANLSWQQQLLQNRLAPAQAQAGYYGTATGGESSANSNLTQLGTASYGPWNALIGAAGQIGAAATPKACWIAAAVFDEDFETGAVTSLVRNWLWEVWIKHWYAKPVLWAYAKWGKWAAQQKLIVNALRPLFIRAANKAREVA